MYQIICVKHTTGKLDNGTPYDNHKFTCLSDSESKALVCGRNVEVFSCTTPTYNNVISSRHLDPSVFPGSYLEPSFNQFGKMVDFKVVPPSEG